jgi:lipopolysaccharide transport system permease protein
MNPVTSIIEAFKFIFLGTGVWHWMGLLYSVLFMIVSLFFSIMLFNKVEKSFMDTV